MKNLRVSDIHCLKSQSLQVEATSKQLPEHLYSVKGCATSRLRRRDYLNSAVFPPGCMGNVGADEDDFERSARERERLSFDEQERAMNILAKVHKYRKLLDARRKCTSKIRLTVRRSQPDRDDLDCLMRIIDDFQQNYQRGRTTPKEATKLCEGDGDMEEIVGQVLTENEIRFMATLMLKKNALGLFESRLRCDSSPSRIFRNPITGDGVEEYKAHERKRDYQAVIKFMDSGSTS